MTLQQLKYVVATAEKGTVSEAAQSLFISQPSLTNAIRELEKEMNITIFIRTNKGITVSKEGEVFLGYARQVLEQASLLEEKYCGKQHGKRQFCISTQHYSFAVNAFVDLIKEFGGDEYDFSIRETQTHEIIEDVARMKSELGILYLNDFNEPVLSKEIKSKELKFTELFSAKPHVFVGSASGKRYPAWTMRVRPLLVSPKSEPDRMRSVPRSVSTSSRRRRISSPDRTPVSSESNIMSRSSAANALCCPS